MAGELKAAEAKLTKARDTLKKQEAGGTESAKLDALKKTVSEAEKSVLRSRASQTLTRDKLQPAKEKKEEWTRILRLCRIESPWPRPALGLVEKLKLMEGKKKRAMPGSVVKDAFAKPGLELCSF